MELGHELSVATLLKLVSLLFWSGLYIRCAVEQPHQNPEWCSRVVTLLHGTVATVIGLSQCGLLNITPCRLTMKITAYHYALMLWSWGYFAFDLLWCLLYWTDSIVMLCHHTSALIAITMYMQKDFTGCTFACNLAMMEITNPLLQTRWFLKNAGYEKTMIFLMVDVAYLVMFIAIRGILGTYVVYKILESNLFDMDEKLITLVFYVVSMAFLYDIAGYIMYKYKNKTIAFRVFLDRTGILLNE